MTASLYTPEGIRSVLADGENELEYQPVLVPGLPSCSRQTVCCSVFRNISDLQNYVIIRKRIFHIISLASILIV